MDFFLVFITLYDFFNIHIVINLLLIVKAKHIYLFFSFFSIKEPYEIYINKFWYTNYKIEK